MLLIKQEKHCSSLCHWNIQDFSEILIYHTLWMLLLKKCSELPSLWLFFLEAALTCVMKVFFFLPHDNSQLRHCTKFYLYNIEKISKYKAAQLLQRSEWQKNITEQGGMYLPHPFVTLKVWPVTVKNDFVFCVLLHTFHI